MNISINHAQRVCLCERPWKRSDCPRSCGITSRTETIFCFVFSLVKRSGDDVITLFEKKMKRKTMPQVMLIGKYLNQEKFKESRVKHEGEY